MLIIFDSIEERDVFFDTMCIDNNCWNAMKISNGIGERDCGVHSCRECWEKSGLQYKVMIVNCEDCKHEDVHEFDEPCKSCGPDNCNFEPKDDK